MNLFFLVEGLRTERVLYPAWLSVLLPQYRQVFEMDAAQENNYYLLGANGYPAIVNEALPAAASALKSIERYSHLIICVDAENGSVAERTEEIRKCIKRKRLNFHSMELEIIVQNRCIETWLLGNSRAMTRAPQDKLFAQFIRFYDVSLNDPEKMKLHDGYGIHAEFHYDYLRLMLKEKNILYTKKFPKDTASEPYLRALIDRTIQQPSHLQTFQSFLTFCRRLGAAV